MPSGGLEDLYDTTRPAHARPEAHAGYPPLRQGSPNNSSSGYSDSERARWSFAASQYRQSAILEMGSAIPMEIVDPQGPKEITIPELLQDHSIPDMSSLRDSLATERDLVRQMRRNQRQQRHQRIQSEPNPSQNRDSFIEDHRISRQIALTDSSLDNRSSAYDHDSDISRSFYEARSVQNGAPPHFVAPLSPLEIPTSLRDLGFVGSPQGSYTSTNNMDDFMTARESSGDEMLKDQLGFHTAMNDSLTSESGPTIKLDSQVIPPQFLNSEDGGEPGLETSGASLPHRHVTTHNHGAESTHFEHSEISSGPTPSTNVLRDESSSSQHGPMRVKLPRSNHASGDLSSFRDGKDDSQHRHASQHSPEDLSATQSKRTDLRRLDTKAPGLSLMEGGVFDSSDPRHSSRRNYSERHHDSHGKSNRHSPNTDHKQGKHRSSHKEKAHEPAEHKHEKRRHFSKKSIEDMLQQTSAAHYDLDDIGLPAPERRLLKKFVDTLSKLSIEVQMDQGKREEGLRRLHNALRALEGWI